MSDLIERDKAYEVVADYFDQIGYSRRYAKALIDKVPSARPKEGMWIKNVDGDYECSECHVAIRGEDKPIYPFCAWCGADMREREGE